VAVAASLLDRCVDSDSSTLDGHTALHHAARNGHVDVIRLALHRGATAEATDREHDATAEDWAAFFRQTEAEAVLREWRSG